MKIGDKIKIKKMDGENHYSGKVGVIEYIDSIGQLHGTWGGLAVQTERDEIELVKLCCICNKEFTGEGNNPYPVKESGECCDECNSQQVISARLRGLV